MDQAERLRDMVKENKPKDEIASRVITVTSGKGGVGKSNFTLNLAIQFSKLGKKVVIIDADFGLANIEVLFGVIPQYNFADVLNERKTLQEVLTKVHDNIYFISGGTGIKELVDITSEQLKLLIESFEALDSFADFILIDTGAGINETVMNFIVSSSETVIITTPEPTSITDAYALIKTLKSEYKELPEIKIVVNRVENQEEAQDVFKKLSNVCKKFLGLEVFYLGMIMQDANVMKAVKQQKPVSLLYKDSAFTKSVENIGFTLLDIERKNAQRAGITGFMKRLLNIFNG